MSLACALIIMLAQLLLEMVGAHNKQQLVMLESFREGKHLPKTTISTILQLMERREAYFLSSQWPRHELSGSKKRMPGPAVKRSKDNILNDECSSNVEFGHARDEDEVTVHSLIRGIDANRKPDKRKPLEEELGTSMIDVDMSSVYRKMDVDTSTALTDIELSPAQKKEFELVHLLDKMLQEARARSTQNEKGTLPSKKEVHLTAGDKYVGIDIANVALPTNSGSKKLEGHLERSNKAKGNKVTTRIEVDGDIAELHEGDSTGDEEHGDKVQASPTSAPRVSPERSTVRGKNNQTSKNRLGRKLHMGKLWRRPGVTKNAQKNLRGGAPESKKIHAASMTTPGPGEIIGIPLDKIPPGVSDTPIFHNLDMAAQCMQERKGHLLIQSHGHMRKETGELGLGVTISYGDYSESIIGEFELNPRVRIFDGGMRIQGTNTQSEIHTMAFALGVRVTKELGSYWVDGENNEILRLHQVPLRFFYDSRSVPFMYVNKEVKDDADKRFELFTRKRQEDLLSGLNDKKGAWIGVAKNTAAVEAAKAVCGCEPSRQMIMDEELHTLHLQHQSGMSYEKVSASGGQTANLSGQHMKKGEQERGQGDSQGGVNPEKTGKQGGKKEEPSPKLDNNGPAASDQQAAEVKLHLETMWQALSSHRLAVEGNLDAGLALQPTGTLAFWRREIAAPVARLYNDKVFKDNLVEQSPHHKLALRCRLCMHYIAGLAEVAMAQLAGRKTHYVGNVWAMEKDTAALGLKPIDYPKCWHGLRRFCQRQRWLHKPNRCLEKTRAGSRPPGEVCALKNLGNTCYVNAALHAFIAACGRPLLRLFRQEEPPGTNRMNPDAFGPNSVPGDWALVFANILQAMTESACVAPTQLHGLLTGSGREFAAGKQGDAMEVVGAILDGLREDLNDVAGIKPCPDKVTRTNYLSPQEMQEAVCEAIKKCAARNNSPIDSRFRGIESCKLACKKCLPREIPPSMSISFDQFFTLQVHIPESRGGAEGAQREITIEDCLASMWHMEQLVGDDAWYCPKCACKDVTFKTTKVVRYPETLVVQLVRFKKNSCGEKCSKIPTPVKFGPELMVEEPGNDDGATQVKYKLKSVILHKGELSSGHYFALARHPTWEAPWDSGPEKWAAFDDCSDIRWHDDDLLDSVDIQEGVYGLFYHRVGADSRDLVAEEEEEVQSLGSTGLLSEDSEHGESEGPSPDGGAKKGGQTGGSSYKKDVDSETHVPNQGAGAEQKQEQGSPHEKDGEPAPQSTIDTPEPATTKKTTTTDSNAVNGGGNRGGEQGECVPASGDGGTEAVGSKSPAVITTTMTGTPAQTGMPPGSIDTGEPQCDLGTGLTQTMQDLGLNSGGAEKDAAAHQVSKKSTPHVDTCEGGACFSDVDGLLCSLVPVDYKAG